MDSRLHSLEPQNATALPYALGQIHEAPLGTEVEKMHRKIGPLEEGGQGVPARGRTWEEASSQPHLPQGF